MGRVHGVWTTRLVLGPLDFRYPVKKEMVQCKKVVPSGIKRFKQHLAGGYGDAVKCSKAPEMVWKDMHAYLKKKSRVVFVQLDEG